MEYQFKNPDVVKEIEIMYPEKLLKFTAQKLETLKKGDFRICQ